MKNIDAYFKEHPTFTLGVIKGKGRFKKVVSSMKPKAVAKSIVRVGRRILCKGGLSEEVIKPQTQTPLTFFPQPKSDTYYTLAESYRLYNSLTLDEISSYCFAHPKAIENHIIENLIKEPLYLLQTGNLIWSRDQYHYVYEYASTDINKKYADLLNQESQIIDKFGEDIFNAQVGSLKRFLPERKTFKQGLDSSLTHFSPNSEIFRKLVIKGTRSREFYRPLTLIAALSNSIKRNFSGVDDIGSEDIIKFYVMGQSVPKYRVSGYKRLSFGDITLEKKRIKTSCMKLGKELAEGFISSLKDADIQKLDTLFNEAFNGNSRLETHKIPVTIPFQKKEIGGKPFVLNNAQREGIAFWRVKNKGILKYGVGLGKTFTWIAEAVRSLNSNESDLALLFVPDQTFEQWLSEIERFSGKVNVYPIREMNRSRIKKLKTYTDKEAKVIKEIEDWQLGVNGQLKELKKKFKDVKIKFGEKETIIVESRKSLKLEGTEKLFLAEVTEYKDQLILDSYKAEFGELIRKAKINNVFAKDGEESVKVAATFLLMKKLSSLLNSLLYYLTYNTGSFQFGENAIVLGNYTALRRLTINKGDTKEKQARYKEIIDLDTYILTQIKTRKAAKDRTRATAQESEKLEAFATDPTLMDLEQLLEGKKRIILGYDEMHNLRNLVTKSSIEPLSDKELDDMEAVGIEKARLQNPYSLIAGEASSQAKRALLLSTYISYLGGRILGLTATPWNKSPLEIYSMLSLLDPRGTVEKLGSVKNFFDFFLREGYELSVNTKGELVSKAEIKGFYSLDVLYSILDDYIISKEAALQRPCKVILPKKDISLPRDSEHCTVIPPNPFKENQGDFVPVDSRVSPTLDQVEIFDAIREWASEGFGRESQERALRAINMMNKAALSPYLFYLNEHYSGRENKLGIPKGIVSKLAKLGYWKVPTPQELVENSPKLQYVVKGIKSLKRYHESKEETLSGQIIYLDRGIMLFDILRQYLVRELELEEEEVGIVAGGYYPYDEQNRSLGKARGFKQGYKSIVQEKFNSGVQKIIIASASVKEGISLQKRTSFLYILTLGWNPTDYKQLIGRAWRQKNRHKYIIIPFVLMRDSLDVFINNKLKVKLRIITALENGTGNVELGEFNPAEAQLELMKDPEKKADILTSLKLEEAQTQQRISENKLSTLEKYQKHKKAEKEEKEAFQGLIELANKRLEEKKQINTSLPLTRQVASLLARIQDSYTLSSYLDVSQRSLSRRINVYRFHREGIIQNEYQVSKIVPSLREEDIQAAKEELKAKIATFKDIFEAINQEKQKLIEQFKKEKKEAFVSLDKQVKDLSSLSYLTQFRFESKPESKPQSEEETDKIAYARAKAKAAQAKLKLLKLKLKLKK